MKKRKGLKYLAGATVLAADLLLSSCSSSTPEENVQVETSIENENAEIDSAISDGVKETTDVENTNNFSMQSTDEFSVERKVLETLISNYEVIYSDEFKNIESFSINWNPTKNCYEIIAENNGTSYEINLPNVDLINYVIHLTNCQEIIINHDKRDGILSCLTECNKIKTISINDSNISSLDGIEKFTNLEALTIINCKNIDDLTPIKDLQNINTINIFGTKISDISVLSNLPNLSYINLRCNEITNPEVLETLENITNLDLEFNRIASVEQLRGLIEKGVLSEDEASSIVESAEKQRLQFSTENYQEEARVLCITYLDSKEAYYVQLLNENSKFVCFALTPDMGDFYGITKDLSNCKGIYLLNFPEIDYSFYVANEKNYKAMVIRNCDFDNLYFVDDFSGLTYLSIDNCPYLVDVFKEPFSIYKLDNLKTLSVVGTNINNFQPLVHVPTLEAIELRNNDITDFEFLTKLPNLQYASIGIDYYPFNADPLKEIQNNGVIVDVPGYDLSEPEQEQEEKLDQEKTLGLTPEN